MFIFSSSPIGRWFAALAAALSLFAVAAPVRAVDFFWTAAVNGAFGDSPRWTPYDPVPPGLVLGPGGAGDTVNFDNGATPLNRYTVGGITGQNDRLLVGNDALMLVLTGDYTLLEATIFDPSFAVGVAAGDVGDVILAGTGTLHTNDVIIGHADDSTGTVVTSLDWVADGPLFVGDFGDGSLTIQNGGSVANTFAVIAAFASGDVVVKGRVPPGSSTTGESPLARATQER